MVHVLYAVQKIYGLSNLNASLYLESLTQILNLTVKVTNLTQLIDDKTVLVLLISSQNRNNILVWSFAITLNFRYESI